MNWPFNDRTGSEISPYAQPPEKAFTDPEPKPDRFRERLAAVEQECRWLLFCVISLNVALGGLFMFLYWWLPR